MSAKVNMMDWVKEKLTKLDQDMEKQLDLIYKLIEEDADITQAEEDYEKMVKESEELNQKLLRNL